MFKKIIFICMVSDFQEIMKIRYALLLVLLLTVCTAVFADDCNSDLKDSNTTSRCLTFDAETMKIDRQADTEEVKEKEKSTFQKILTIFSF